MMKRWICWNHKQFCLGKVEGDGPSSSKKCLLDELRCKHLSSDYQDGMRGRVECHQHSSDMKSHDSESESDVLCN